MQQDKSERSSNSLGMFDLSRGILMILIMFGHSVNAYVTYWTPEKYEGWQIPFLFVFKLVISGVVPMFFMMNGYFFRRKADGRFIRERISKIVKPYVITGAAILLLAVIKKLVTHGFVLSALQYQGIPLLLGICPGNTVLFGVRIGEVGPLWFLLALFFGGIILNLIFRLESEIMRVFILAVMVSFATGLQFHAFIPYCIVQSLCCAGYLYIGYVIKKNQLLFCRLPVSNVIILWGVVLAADLWGNSDVSQNVWKLGMLDYLASAAMGFLLLRIGLKLNRLKGRLFCWLRQAGRYSLYIFCLHSIEMLVFPWQSVTGALGNNIYLCILATFFARGAMVYIGYRLLRMIVAHSRKK